MFLGNEWDGCAWADGAASGARTPGDLVSPVYRLSKPQDTLRRHVIEEYRHRAQTVTCVCGWHGSTATSPGDASAWAKHVSENRGKTF